MTRPRRPEIDPACGKLAAADTGLRTGCANRELDRRQVAWSRDRRIALLRLHSSQPSAWLGAHEHERHALRPEYCRTRGIPVLRRLSGGGACYRDPRQWNFTLSVPLHDRAERVRLAPWPRLVGGALQAGLRRLGVAADVARTGHIEVAGRTLGEVFVAIHDDVLVAEAHLFRAVDTPVLLRVLRVPKEKLTPEGVRSAHRHYAALDGRALPTPTRAALLAAVRASCAEALGLTPSAFATPAPAQTAPAAPLPPAADDAGALTGFVQTCSGVLHGALHMDAAESAVASLAIHGDVQFHPHHLLDELCAALAGAPLDDAMARLEGFLARHPHELLGFRRDDLLHLLRLLLGRRVLQRRFGLSTNEAGTVMVHDPDGRGNVPALLARAQVMLVPYCAKPTWCRWRHREDCPECGRCAVGSAYRLGRARGMHVVTIRNFEHLEATLRELRGRRVGAYVGMCCRNFFLKREYAFRAAGLPAVLLDITGANCYELRQEELAYTGRFEAQAELDLPVLEKLMAAVPPCGPPIPARRRARAGRRGAAKAPAR